MKKFIALVLTFVMLLLFVGCQENQPQNTETSSNTTNKIETKIYSKTAIKIENVLKVCSGELSKEDIKSNGKGGTIKARRRAFYYKKNYTNTAIIPNLDLSSIQQND